jgi:uncharacterized protein (DUF2235 family)
MAKNILIFADGTGNSGQAHRPTNVYKLFQMVKDSDPARQTAFYIKGVGTNFDYLGFMTGLGISKNIQACYRYLCANFEKGDKIFLFGFSRGAATVRSLSGLIHLMGLAPDAAGDPAAVAYEIYKIRHPIQREQQALKFRETHNCRKVDIHFLGVWDTVISLGFIYEFLNSLFEKKEWLQISFHDFHLSPSVHHARHALAIDEKRFVFSAKLWDSLPLVHQTIKQMWFVGTHKNVGGGWAKGHALSDIALQWMIDEATAHGLVLSNPGAFQLRPDPLGQITPTFRLSFAPRSWNRAKLGRPLIHESVFTRQKEDPSYQPWILRDEDSTAS